MFYKARIKLTLWYVLMIMIISLLFSLAIYQIQMNELRRIDSIQRTRINKQLEMRKMAPLVFELEFVEEIRQRLVRNLLYLNGIILLISGICAWILSGKTLSPIHVMMVEQSRFISDASHELKTPLTSLKTAFEVFGRSKKSTLTEARHIIKESILEVDRLQKLTDSLLQLAQVQQSLPVKIFEKYSLNDLINNALKKIKPISQKKSIDVKVEGPEVLAEVIPDDMTNLFVTLIENAVKYSPKKSIIQIAISASRSQAHIKIQDSGVGIAKKDLPHIFDRFYRSDTVRTHTDTSGYGLGLSIARDIVTKHSGDIKIETTENKGSTFIVRIPLKYNPS